MVTSLNQAYDYMSNSILAMKIPTLFIQVKEGHVEQEKPRTLKIIMLGVIFSELLATNYVKSLQRLLLQCEITVRMSLKITGGQHILHHGHIFRC